MTIFGDGTQCWGDGAAIGAGCGGGIDGRGGFRGDSDIRLFQCAAAAVFVVAENRNTGIGSIDFLSI